MNQNQTKGITLVALVITIIVMLILAGVGITFTTGILKRAKYTRFLDEMAKVKESITVKALEEKVNTLGDSTSIFAGTMNTGEWNNIDAGLKYEIAYSRDREEGKAEGKLPTEEYYKDYVFEEAKDENGQGTGNIAGIFFVDKELTSKDDKAYIYDEESSEVYRIEPEIIEGVPVHSNGLGGLLLGNNGLLGQLQDSANKPAPPEEPEKPEKPEEPSIPDGTNPPELSQGLIPIYYDELEGEWKVADKDNKNNMWYEYTETAKRWANICTVSDEINTSKNYRTAPVGTIIPIKDMTTMFVWIPRYAYKLKSTLNPITSTIEVIFNISEDITTDYVIHPAFNYDGKNLNGIWVAKFEASNTNNTVTVLPNKTAWTAINVSNIFTTCLEMSSKYSNAYGIISDTNEIDPHQMKNTEWGAVAYLAQSKYGKNAEIWINNSSNYITGSCGNFASAGTNVGTTTFNSGNGFQASSSGNITGVYDMSGGTAEYTAAYVADKSAETYGAAIYKGAPKYKNRYYGESHQAVWSDNRKSIFGDAFWETSHQFFSKSGAWYGDYSMSPDKEYPFFVRGGNYDYASYAGAFAFNRNDGNSNSKYGFRPVLAVPNEL